LVADHAGLEISHRSQCGFAVAKVDFVQWNAGGKILALSGAQVIEYCHFVPRRQRVLHDVTTDESRSPSDE